MQLEDVGYGYGSHPHATGSPFLADTQESRHETEKSARFYRRIQHGKTADSMVFVTRLCASQSAGSEATKLLTSRDQGGGLRRVYMRGVGSVVGGSFLHFRFLSEGSVTVSESETGQQS